MQKLFIITTSLSLLLFGCSSVLEDQKTNSENFSAQADTENTLKKETSSNNETSTLKAYGDRGNTSGNILNGGIAVEDGDMIFYSDSKNLIATHKDQISDMDNIGEVIDSVEDGEGIINSINVIDDTLYYVKDSSINKIGINGTDKEQIPTSFSISQMILYKEQIIFTVYDVESDSFSIYRMGTDGQNIEKVASAILNFYVDQGKLYWSEKINKNDYMLYTDDLENDDKPLGKHFYNSLHSFQVNGDTLYFLNEKDYFKMNLNGDGGDIRNITANMKEKGTTIDMPNIFGDTIYYTENQNMFAMNTVGSARWEVPAGSIYAYSLAGGHLFYWGFGQGEYSLAIKSNVSEAYDEAIEEFNSIATDSWVTPPELLELYDTLYDLDESISIRELEEQENEFVAGNILFPQEHLIGATKALLFGISTKNEDLLMSLLATPEENSTIFSEALIHLPIKEDQFGGYYDFEIKVLSDDSMYVHRDTPGYDMNVKVEFKEIDGKYYFKRFRDL